MIRRALCKVAGFLQKRRGKGGQQKCQQCQQCQQFQHQCIIKEKDDKVQEDVGRKGKGDMAYEVRDSEVMGRSV